MLIVLTLTGAAGVPLPVPAQTDATAPPADGEALDQNYSNVKVSIYTKHLRRPDPRDWAARLKLQAAAAIYKYEKFDDFLNRDIDHLQSIGVRPKLEFEFPLRVEYLSFVPDVELAWHYLFDGNRNLISGSTAAGLQYLRPVGNYEFLAKAEARYGTRYLEDGQNLDDFVELSLELRWINALRFGEGRRVFTVSPVLKCSEFIDDLEFVTDLGTPFDVERKYELGLQFSTLPRVRLGPVKLPNLRISYVFGKDFSGIQLRL